MPFDLVKDSLTGSWRLATNRVRHLPTTVIVGAQKAGTTQLYAYHGEASAVLRCGGEGSRLLFEASEAAGGLVSVAVSLAATRVCGGRGT